MIYILQLPTYVANIFINENDRHQTQDRFASEKGKMILDLGRGYTGIQVFNFLTKIGNI